MRPHSHDRIAHRALLPPVRLVVVLRRGAAARTETQLAIAVYGFGIGVTLAAAWFVLSMTKP